MSKAAQVSSAAKARAVADAVRAIGKSNPQFPKDVDVSYGDLAGQLSGKVDGLKVVLKNMRRDKMVDYRGDVILDNTVVTLIEDWEQSSVFVGISYDEINSALAHLGDQGGHQKVVSE